MSENTYNPEMPLTEYQLANMTMEEYRNYLASRINARADAPETLGRYHLAIQLRYTNNEGVNDNPIMLVTCTQKEYSPKLGDYHNVLLRQGYNVRVLHDPTGEAQRRENSHATDAANTIKEDINLASATIDLTSAKKRRKSV